MCPDSSQTHILLIDDDLLVANSLKKLLQLKKYMVSVANNSAEALSLVSKVAFDVVISDIRMPGENGVEIIRKIKAIYENRGCDCRYVFITGYA